VLQVNQRCAAITFLLVLAASARGAGVSPDAPSARGLVTAPLQFIGAGGQSAGRDAAGASGSRVRMRVHQVDTSTLSFIGTGASAGAATSTPMPVGRETVQTEELKFIGDVPAARSPR
jgi:hypothetical protein